MKALTLVILFQFLITSKAGASTPWSIVVLPDTQLYSTETLTPHNTLNFPDDGSAVDDLNATIDWIVDGVQGANQHNIKLVLMEGDIVHLNKPAEWQSKRASFEKLDGVVPYMLSTGNHDYHNGTPFNRGTLFNDYFKLSDNELNFSQNGIFTREKTQGELENTYATFNAPDGRKLLIFNLEFGPRDSVVSWANGIASLSQYQDHTAILLTHSYLEEYLVGSNNGRLNSVRNQWSSASTPSKDQETNEHNPHYWADSPWALKAGHNSTLGKTYNPTTGVFIPDPVNDGQELWDGLIKNNGNFEMVLNGHHAHGFGSAEKIGAAYLKSPSRGAMPYVHQMYFNAQFTGHTASEGHAGGKGYIRILTFDGATVRVRTYSPLLDDFREEDPNPHDFTFTLSAIPSPAPTPESNVLKYGDFIFKDSAVPLTEK